MSVALLCLLTNLPGPPSVVFQNLYLQLYPVIKEVCPLKDINPDRDVYFELYTRNNPTTPQILKPNNDSLLQASNIDFKKPTIIFFHGFMESSKSPDSVLIRDDYLKKGDYNVILASAERLLAGPFYISSALNVQAIGKYSATVVDYLVSKGLQLSNLHLIGMSLGGQIVGVLGSALKSGKIARITGLDPAGPLFAGIPKSDRLDEGDAEFVDVVHSNGGLFGYPSAIGHVDFWLNGDKVVFQPGCLPTTVFKTHPGSIPELLFCSHYRSYRSFAETINKPKAFPGRKCTNWDQFNSGKCSTNELAFMGESVVKTARGSFYVKTASSPPYYNLE